MSESRSMTGQITNDRIDQGGSDAMTEDDLAILSEVDGSLSKGPPVNTSTVALLNALTLGQAGQQLCISNEDIQKWFLVKHFTQNYAWIVNSLLTWRQIPNWLDSAALPEWVVKGEKSITLPNKGT